VFILLFGPPGAGKGTQSTLLSERLKIPHVSTGEILRAAILGQSALGLQVEECIAAGRLVPDTLITDVVAERIGEPDCANGCILDGFPRTIPQADALDEVLTQRNSSIHAVIQLAVDMKELLERLSKRSEVELRSDDSPETIAGRLEIYEQETSPLIAYYEKRGQLRRIDGMAPVETVSQRIIEAIRDASKQSD